MCVLFHIYLFYLHSNLFIYVNKILLLTNIYFTKSSYHHVLIYYSVEIPIVAHGVPSSYKKIKSNHEDHVYMHIDFHG